MKISKKSIVLPLFAPSGLFLTFCLSRIFLLLHLFCFCFIILQIRFDSHTINSANLYQIFTYVKNKTLALGEKGHNVSGMLLYAKTDDLVQPSGVYKMSGNTIEVRTLDLNLDFCDIKQQLESIVDAYFQ